MLAIVADVDSCFGLLRYDRAQCIQAGRGDLVCPDAFPAGAPDEQAGQILRPRQASGMRR